MRKKRPSDVWKIDGLDELRSAGWPASAANRGLDLEAEPAFAPDERSCCRLCAKTAAGGLGGLLRRTTANLEADGA